MIKGILSNNAVRWLLAIAAAWSVLSCSPDSEDEAGNISDKRKLVFRTHSGENSPFMEEGATLGVFLTSRSTGEVLRSNELIVIGEKGAPLQQRDTLFPAVMDDYEFFAYSPYDSSWDDVLESVLEFEVSADQSSDVNLRSSDLMLSYDIVKGKYSEEVFFSHVMAKIVIHVTDRTGLFDMTASGAVLHGLRCGAYINTADGSCQSIDNDTSDIICNMLDSRDRRASLTAVIPPQQLENEILPFSVILGDAEYEFSVSGVHGLEGEKVYVYSLNMTDRGLALEDSTIMDWEDGASGSLNVAFE